MAIGSDSLTIATPPTPIIHIAPDKPGSEAESDLSVHVTRSGIRIGRHSSDLLTFVEFWEHRYSLCINDDHWSDSIRPIISGLDSQINSILVEPDSYHLTPKALYREEDTIGIIELAGVSTAGKSVVVEELNALEAMLIWTVPKKVAELLEKVNGKMIPDLAITNLLSSTGNSTNAHLLNRAEKVEVAVFRNGLQLVNSYRTPTDNDRLYFLIAACTSCGADPNQTTVNVHGNFGEDLNKLISNYFKLALPAEMPQNVKVPYAFKDHSPCEWSALLKLHRCG